MINAHELDILHACAGNLVEHQQVMPTSRLVHGILETLTHERAALSADTVTMLRMIAAQLWAGEIVHESDQAIARARALH